MKYNTLFLSKTRKNVENLSSAAVLIGALSVNFVCCNCKKKLQLFLDPDQARHFVGPDLGPHCLTLMVVFLKKISRRQNIMKIYPACRV